MGGKVLITGITGQDGSYLAEFLLDRGYEVHGIVRRVAVENRDHRLWRVRSLLGRIHLHAASLENYPSLFQVMHRVRPDEIYHLAAQSNVSYSFEDEFSTLAINVNGTHFMLAAVREVVPRARFFFAASSEMFGNAEQFPQTERTPFRPRSAYGISKVAGYHLTRNYREAYGLKASCGIFYNHESPRRGFEFVTRKISSYAARIKLGHADSICLGNLDARRDWGHAARYVRAMWRMLQRDEGDDYVIATGQAHSVREFLETAFDVVGLDPYRYLRLDRDLMRPSDVESLVGDPAKAERDLGWSYDLKFQDLVREMVETDLELYSSGPAAVTRDSPVLQ